MNIKVLVCQIIGPATAGSVGPVPIRPIAGVDAARTTDEGLSLFHSGLKSFLFCKSSLPQPFLFLIQVSLYGFPADCLLLLLSISVFLLFSFFLFLHFLVVGSVR